MPNFVSKHLFVGTEGNKTLVLFSIVGNLRGINL